MVYKLDAVKREANAEPFEFEFDGERYTLPDDMDVRAAECFAEADVRGALEILLGAEACAKLYGSPKVLSMEMLNDMIAEWCDHIGVDTGESLASSRSLRRAAARSKRTSNGSTASPSRTSTRTRRG